MELYNDWDWLDKYNNYVDSTNLKKLYSSININNGPKKINYSNDFLKINSWDSEIEESLNTMTYHAYIDDYMNNFKYNYNYQIKDNDFEELFFKIFVGENKKYYLNDELIDNDSEKYLLQNKESKKIISNNDKNGNFSMNINVGDLESNKTNISSKNKENVIILINQNEIEKKDTISLLNKKRNISKKDFSIFNYGKYDNYSRKIINETLKEIEKEKINLFATNFIYSKQYKKRLKTIHKRKEGSDNIRKKIKRRFHKILKDIINSKLEKAGSNKYFDFLPQLFVSDISKNNNKEILNLTLEEILSLNFCVSNNKNDSTTKKYYHNLSVLEYLEKNKDISIKSNFNNIKNMKYYEIYEEYLNSKEFEMEISELKKEKENDKYIKKYIIKAISLIKYFNQWKKTIITFKINI